VWRKPIADERFLVEESMNHHIFEQQTLSHDDKSFPKNLKKGNHRDFEQQTLSHDKNSPKKGNKRKKGKQRKKSNQRKKVKKVKTGKKGKTGNIGDHRIGG